MMFCPTCDNTTQLLSETVSWCPRCGTCYQTALRLTHVPKLVERCRDFQHWLPTMCDITRAGFATSGIAEAINISERRT